jgi:hypothetical protein
MDTREVFDTACNLYGGGWRAGDKDWLIDEYEITEEEAEMLCEALEEIESMQEAE